MKNNNYKKGCDQLIKDNKLTLKNVKTFQGRQGVGVSATIYFEGKQCGTFLDEANGGEYFHDWNYNCDIADKAWKYLMALPKFSDKEWKEAINSKVQSYDKSERDNTWKWYWADAILQPILNKRDFNKWLRNICIFSEKEQRVIHYKAKKAQLTQMFRTENGVMSGREYFGSEGIILNDLPKEEAYDYFNRYCI